MIEEIWKAIDGWEGIYEVSSLGSVRRISIGGQGRRPGPLKVRFHKNGYCYVTLTSIYSDKPATKYLVHRLVCKAFRGAPPSLEHQAAHWDGNKANNNKENVRWATQRENEDDKIRHKTLLLGERHPQAKLKELDVRYMFELVALGFPKSDIRNLWGIKKYQLDAICRGSAWKHLNLPLDTISRRGKEMAAATVTDGSL